MLGAVGEAGYPRGMPAPSRRPRGGPPARVYLVDDHPIVRQGIRDLVDAEPDFAVCGEADDAPSALTALCDDGVDVAIVDISLRRGGGLDLIRSVRSQGVRIPILVLSMHEDWLYAERSLRAGADGYLNKAEAGEKVVDALRCVLAGEIHVSDAVRTRSLRQAFQGRTDAGGDPVEQLSDREMEVFEALGDGMPMRRIAERLGLSIKTVETHRAHIKEKLGLESPGELFAYAARWKADHS